LSSKIWKKRTKAEGSKAQMANFSLKWLNVQEACALIEVGFEYVTGEYNDGGKIF
jgi:hypothetical protein